MPWREESENVPLSYVIRQITSKISGKIMHKPLLFRKDSSSPRMTKQIQIL